MGGLHFVTAGATDVGREREVNEDAFALLAEEKLWVLADGMGGHASGQIASRMAVDVVVDFMSRWRHESDFEWPFDLVEGHSREESALANAIRVANVRLFNRAQTDEACDGMGTTVVAVTYGESGLVVAHVGDSRCYRLRDAELVQLTEDHSLVNHLKRFFHLSEEEAQQRAGSNVIVRAVGLEDDVEAELTIDQPQPGDRYLSCSDGLSDLVDVSAVTSILTERPEPQEAADALVLAANEAGGTDNITVVVLDAHA